MELKSLCCFASLLAYNLLTVLVELECLLYNSLVEQPQNKPQRQLGSPSDELCSSHFFQAILCIKLLFGCVVSICACVHHSSRGNQRLGNLAHGKLQTGQTRVPQVSPTLSLQFYTRLTFVSKTGYFGREQIYIFTSTSLLLKVRLLARLLH